MLYTAGLTIRAYLLGKTAERLSYARSSDSFSHVLWSQKGRTHLPWFGKSAYLQILKIWVSCTVEYVYMLRIFWVNQESRGGLVPEIQHWQKRVSARNCQSLSGKSAYLQYAWIRLIPADLDHSKCNICTLISSCLTQSEFIVFISLPQDAYRCNKW